MQNVIGFYGYLVCCIDFEKRGEQLQEKEPYLSVNVIYNPLLYLYMDQHCVFFLKNHNTAQTITVFIAINDSNFRRFLGTTVWCLFSIATEEGSEFIFSHENISNIVFGP